MLPLTFNKMLRENKIKPRDLNHDVNIAIRVERLNGKVHAEKEIDMVLRNLVRILYAQFANYDTQAGQSITVTDSGGSARTGVLQGTTSVTYVRGTTNWWSLGGVADDLTGIQIGLGTTAPTRVDYVLQNKIPHGSGSGQIYYQQQSFELLSDYQFRLTREFTNAGSNLSVTEAGMMYKIGIAGAWYSVLFLRDTFSPLSVTTGNGCRIRYTFNF